MCRNVAISVIVVSYNVCWMERWGMSERNTKFLRYVRRSTKRVEREGERNREK